MKSVFMFSTPDVYVFLRGFLLKIKNAIKLHLWERIRRKGSSGPNEALILEMVAAEAIAGYTFCLIGYIQLESKVSTECSLILYFYIDIVTFLMYHETDTKSFKNVKA